MCWFGGFGTCLGNELWDREHFWSHRVERTPSTAGMSPAGLHQGWGLSPQWEPAQSDLVAFHKGPAKSSECRFQLELALEQTQALTFPEFGNVSLRAQFWGSCGKDSPM